MNNIKHFQKGSIGVLIFFVVIVVLLVAGLFLFSHKPQKSQPVLQTQQTTSTDQTMQSDADLMNASNVLDNTNIDKYIDTTLNQNDADASSF